MERSSEQIMLNALEKEGMVLHVDIQSTNNKRHKPDLDFQAEVKEAIGLRARGRALKVGVLPASTFKMPHDLVRIYIPQTDSDSVTRVCKIYNEAALAMAEANAKMREAVLNNTLFASATEKNLVLMHRFVKRREAFFTKYKMFNAEDALKVMGIDKANSRREISTLETNSHIITLLRNKQKIIPKFQFNAKGQVYSSLMQHLKDVKLRQVAMLDFCFWLTDPQTVLLDAPQAPDMGGDVSFEEAIVRANRAMDNSKVYQGKPIDLLAKGDVESLQQFDTLITRWLSTEDNVTAEQEREGEAN